MQASPTPRSQGSEARRHGIFPAILDAGGLTPALAHLGDCTRVVMSVDDRTAYDLPVPVDHAAYLAVPVAHVAAPDDGGRPLRVRLEHIDPQNGQTLKVEIPCE